MSIRPSFAILAGALLSAILGIAAASQTAAPYVERLAAEAEAIAGNDVTVRFADREGYPSRHAMLTPARELDEGRRADLAKQIGAIDGIGGVHWTDGTMLAEAGEAPLESLRCQDDVQAILTARTLRFEESSAALAAGGTELLDEVAAALRPCYGAIIAITGHTDTSGDEPANIVLSRRRAAAVERALVARGVPEESLRINGLGSSQPVQGLDPADPANRRIEFSVVAKQRVRPTPIDLPGPR
ncbi:OmpA family protein [Erythrobacter litoralis]|uniref:Putative outer membrane lipoprotein n=1 Tax=Erythrobacter litoralis (strain HTCC2594) TaxID=314225 RepID=Q2N8R3_ERYLH|nr:OmpA family protein [Erythrobacter litoralis]ABC63928.1 putative outer membrane lipoprotein [Erythrobacter litoralis HTCC2594]